LCVKQALVGVQNLVVASIWPALTPCCEIVIDRRGRMCLTKRLRIGVPLSGMMREGLLFDPTTY
jgi:hypothetical protein